MSFIIEVNFSKTHHESLFFRPIWSFFPVVPSFSCLLWDWHHSKHLKSRNVSLNSRHCDRKLHTTPLDMQSKCTTGNNGSVRFQRCIRPFSSFKHLNYQLHKHNSVKVVIKNDLGMLNLNTIVCNKNHGGFYL
mgnify:CR=1 FL=1